MNKTKHRNKQCTASFENSDKDIFVNDLVCESVVHFFLFYRGQFRPWSDCENAQTDLELHSSCTA